MMKKRLKAAAAAAMALAMLGGALPVVPGGAELLKAPLTAHAAGYAVLNNTDNTLYLSGEVTREQILGFKYNDNVKKIVCNSGCILPEDCSRLFEVEQKFWDSVECWIEYSGWQSVESIDFTHADTSHVKNMKYMFASPTDRDFDSHSWEEYYSCPKLLGLDHFDTSSVTDMHGMFWQNKADTLDLSSFDTSNVTDMSGMFAYCGNLGSLNLSSFDTSNVTDMEEMFYKCDLYSLDLSSFDTSKVTNMDSMFAWCWRLKTIYVSDLWSTDAVTSAYRMFFNCDSLVGEFGTKNESGMWRENAYYAHIDSGEFNPGFFTDINAIRFDANSSNYVKGVGLGLSSRIGITFYVNLNDQANKVVLAGYPGEVTVTDLTPIESGDYKGCVKLVYPVNATEARRRINLCVYDKDGKRMPLYNSDHHRVIDNTVRFSVQEYLAKASTYYPDNEKALALADALKNYCNAASNYFCGKHYTVNGIGDITADSFSTFKAPLNGLKIALVLNSQTELRVYGIGTTENYTARNGQLPDLIYDAEGGYHKITGITPKKLANGEEYLINGKYVVVSPLTYGYYVMNNSDDKALKTVVRALFVYAKTALAY